MRYGKRSFNLDAPSIANALQQIIEDRAKRVEISSKVKVYKVPSANPKRYVVRIDITENLEDE